MRRILDMFETLENELDSAQKYAEASIDEKLKSNHDWVIKYKTMAKEEITHAANIHEKIVIELEELKSVYTPPNELMALWEHEHKEFIERSSVIRTMLSM